MAARSSPTNPFDQLADFARTVDELFDDLLITRWRERGASSRHGASVIERPDAYEVRLTAPGADPKHFEVEVSERRLVVRMRGPEGPVERAFEFAVPVQAEKVIARCQDGTLLIVLPKKPGRRVAVE